VKLEYDFEQKISESLYFFDRPKSLNLTKPQLTLTPDSSTKSLTITTDVIAKDIFLYVDGVDVWFSDNYFDLIPGAVKVVTAKS